MNKIFFAVLLGLYSQAGLASDTATNTESHNPSGSDLAITNFPEIRQQLSLTPLKKGHLSRAIRVAVLDKGFDGATGEIGKSLPIGTQIITPNLAVPADLKVDHGFRMAQVVSALVTEDMEKPDQLELFLLNSYGFTNFQASIKKAIELKVDLILYSEVWEYGGNGDGQGFINAEVDKAIDAGILWINASGNFGLTTFNSEIVTGEENWVKLPDQNNAIKIICKAKENEKCGLKAVLSWNDFKNSADEGTDKDLDFALTDDLLNIRQSSALRQTKDSNPQPGSSKYPREIISDQLPPGTYFLKVKNYSQNFSDSDQLRLTVDGDYLEMPTHDQQESLLVPADNPGVITIGALDSDRSGQSVKLSKPDFKTISSLKLEDESEYRGSSNSAAIAAAIVAREILQRGPLSRRQALETLRTYNSNPTSPGGGIMGPSISLRSLGFSFTGPGCFVLGSWAEAPEYLRPALAAGGSFVQTTSGWRIMTPFDPIRLAPPYVMRLQIDDRLTLGPAGWQIFPRNSWVPQGQIEVFQQPPEAGVCQ